MNSADSDQRWAYGTPRWVQPVDGVFQPIGWTVERIQIGMARPFVEAHHYSAAMPATRFCYGLHSPDRQLAGVAVYGIPASKQVLTIPFPDLEPYVESIELSRLVLHDDVRFNAESWFVTRTLADLKHLGVRGVVSFSDPQQRTRLDGTIVMPGHWGTVYQGCNFIYTGRATSRPIILLPDGTVFSARAASKIRQQDRGHRYAERILQAHGATPMQPGDDPTGWMHNALHQIGARTVRHPGNHRYCLTLGRRNQHHLQLEPVTYPRKPT